MSFRTSNCRLALVVCLSLFPLLSCQAQNDVQQVANNKNSLASHVIHFEGVKHDYPNRYEAEEALTANLKRITSHDVVVDSLDETSASWHSNNITDCDTNAMQQLLETIQTPNGFTRAFKMFITEKFKPPKHIRIDWAGQCRKRNLEDFNKPSTAAPLTTTTVEPSPPTTLADQPELVTTQPTTTVDVLSTVSSSTEDSFNKDLFPNDKEFATMNFSDINMDLKSSITTSSSEVNATTPLPPAPSSTNSSQASEPSTVGPTTTLPTTTTPTTTTPTVTPTTITTRTADEPSSTVSNFAHFDSTPSSLAVEIVSGISELNLESVPQNASIPAETESITKTDAVSAADGPHYGKYIGLSAGFLMVVAYLVVGRAHGRRAMYDLA